MKKLLASIVALALLFPAAAAAQLFEVRVQVVLPPSPTFVVVAPGIQVVENSQDEVFFADGYYWTRRDSRWYRAPRPHAAYFPVERRYVPVGIARVPPGRYKHYRKEGKGGEKGHHKGGPKHGPKHGRGRA